MLARLDAAGARRGRVVGVTGAPGAGKSTLVGELAVRLVAAAPGRAVAVLAVDPSSPVSGGALLGDRTRVRFPAGEPRLYFRSQAAAGELGGVARTTFQVCRLLTRLFDVVFVETVGVGQSEIEIVRVADRTYLIVPPLAGDHVQFMKAGIMELPDAFVVSKADVGEPASATFHALRASLRLARPGAEVPLHRVSARTGAGVDTLCAEILTGPAGAGVEARAAHFFERWVAAEHGRRGVARLTAAGGAAAYVAAHGGFEAAQAAFDGEVGA
ncbi:MAG: protein kinase [Kofleriaceae bacterium]|nr:protein kinase [Kofleriaceae bacterium]